MKTELRILEEPFNMQTEGEVLYAVAEPLRETIQRNFGPRLSPRAPELVLFFILMLCGSAASAQTDPQPSRWDAGYTQIYSDSIETLAPVLDAGVLVKPARPNRARRRPCTLAPSTWDYAI